MKIWSLTNPSTALKRKKPITVYKDEQTAVNISPISASSEVLMYFRDNK